MLTGVGEVFAGRYELVDPLGHGGWGTVWRVWDRRSSRYVAAKVLGQSDASMLLRFVREQSYRIAHPHVVTPLGWAGEDDRVLFTMPIVAGGSVHTLVGDHGALPQEWAAVLLDQLLDALTAVHAVGLVHRDVKPANLLLEPTGRDRPHLRLSDFGVAVALAEPRMTRTSVVLGTPGYLAPEQLRGAEPEPRQDLYAAGIVAAQMLTGAKVDPVTGIDGACPAGVAPRLWKLVTALGATTPSDRPTSAAAARSALHAAGTLPADGTAPAQGPDGVEVFVHVPELPPGWGRNGRLDIAGEPTASARPEPPREFGRSNLPHLPVTDQPPTSQRPTQAYRPTRHLPTEPNPPTERMGPSAPHVDPARQVARSSSRGHRAAAVGLAIIGALLLIAAALVLTVFG